MSRARRPISALLASTTGAAAIMVGLVTPVILGTAALGIDVGNWYVRRAELQSVSDAVAASAALESIYGNIYNVSYALSDAAYTGVDTSTITSLVINSPPISGAYAGDNSATEVLVTAPGTKFLAGLVFGDQVNITARAVATAGIITEACMIGLNESSSKAISSSGTVNLTMSCGVASNSDDPRSVWLNGTVNFDVPSVITSGGVQDQGGALDDVPTNTDARPIDDPYSDLDLPFFSGCDYNDLHVTSSTTLSPGVYCGGLKIGGSSTVNLDPGTYIMDSGDFEIAGDTYVYGTGVTIILTSSSSSYGSIKITGGTEVSLSAPTSGDYAGIVIFQDPDAPEGNSNDITGTADMDIEGAVYLPSGDLNIGGNGDYSGECTQLIADTVTLVGDAQILNNCEDMPISITGPLRAQLVEWNRGLAMHNYLKLLSDLCWSKNGTSAIEFALVAPVIILVLVGLVDFGAVIRDKIELNNAAATAARYVLSDVYSETNLVSIATNGSDLNAADVTATVTSVCGCVGGVAATCGDTCADGEHSSTYLVVSLSQTNEMIIPYPGFSDMTITGISRMRLE